MCACGPGPGAVATHGESTETSTTDAPDESTDAETGSVGVTSTTGASETTSLETDLPAACQTYEAWVPQLRMAPLVHVIDRSARMADHTYDHDLDPETPERTPWSVLHEALAYSTAMAYGHAAVIAPGLGADDDAQACASEQLVVAQPACADGSHVLPALPPAGAGPDELVGGAPLVAAHDAAVELLLTWPHLHVGSGTIVLAMHTPPSCEPGVSDPLERLDPRLLERVTQAREQHGIDTMVVGVDVTDATSPVEQDGAPDGVNLRVYLNELALAGGYYLDHPEDQYFDAREPVAIAEALDSLACGVVGCTIPIEGGLMGEPEDVSLSVYGEAFEPIAIEDCADEDGWAWTDETRTELELCGGACARYHLHDDPCVEPPEEPAVVVEHGCPAEP